MSIPADDWNNRLKEYISGLAGLVPEIGGMLKFLIGIFWPTSKDDIWTLLQNQIIDLVYQIVDAEILKNELAERKGELDGLRDDVKLYVNALTHEKGSLLSAMLVKCNTIFNELNESLNDVHFLPIAVTLACQHLSLLKERVQFGKDMYDEDNTPQWKADLVKFLKNYQDYFLHKKVKWDQWRNEEIEEKFYTKRPGPISPPDSYCDITDHVTGTKWQYLGRSQSNPRILKPGADMLKQRVFSSSNAELLKMVYVPVFVLGRFIPGHEHDKPVADKSIGIIQLGPFSVASLGKQGHEITDFQTFTGQLSHDGPGKITQVDVRAYNSIDATQIHYKGHDGTFVGNPEGGAAHTFPVADKAVVNFVHMGFHNGLLAEVQYKCSDNTDTGKLGNKSGWNIRADQTVDLETSAILDKSFVLRVINMQGGSGPDPSTGVANVILTYYHTSLMQ